MNDHEKRIYYKEKQFMKVVKLIKLRNPWGKSEFYGRFKRKDPIWTDELKTHLNYNKNEEGVFYMTYEEFSSWFQTFQICYYHDDYSLSSYRFKTQPQQRLFFTFNIDEDRSPEIYYFT